MPKMQRFVPSVNQAIGALGENAEEIADKVNEELEKADWLARWKSYQLRHPLGGDHGPIPGDLNVPELCRNISHHSVSRLKNKAVSKFERFQGAAAREFVKGAAASGFLSKKAKKEGSEEEDNGKGAAAAGISLTSLGRFIPQNGRRVEDSENGAAAAATGPNGKEDNGEGAAAGTRFKRVLRSMTRSNSPKKKAKGDKRSNSPKKKAKGDKRSKSPSGAAATAAESAMGTGLTAASGARGQPLISLARIKAAAESIIPRRESSGSRRRKAAEEQAALRESSGSRRRKAAEEQVALQKEAEESYKEYKKLGDQERRLRTAARSQNITDDDANKIFEALYLVERAKAEKREEAISKANEAREKFELTVGYHAHHGGGRTRRRSTRRRSTRRTRRRIRH